MSRVLPSRLLVVAFAVFLLIPAPGARADALVARLVVNGEQKGDVFAERTPGGDFLLRVSDLLAAGLRDARGTETEIGGETYVLLGSVKGLSFSFDEEALSLNLAAAPDILPVRTIDFGRRAQRRVERPRDTSGFLNYRVGYAGDDGFASWTAENQIGFRRGDWLFLSDSTYRKSGADQSFVRLQTSVTRDRLETMQRTVVGDVSAASGEFGNAVNLGGASLSKVYRIDPYFRRHPLAGLAGLVSRPSDARVYLDGMLLRTEKLAPGGFELKNLDYYGGASTVSVVITDAFGREERIASPFYFTDAVLRKGLHEYSYNAGFLREDFGVASNRYGAFAFSMFHDYGLSDAATAGFRAEGGGGMVNLGPQAYVLLGNAGVIAGAVSGSYDRERGGGGGGLLSYVYQDNTATARAFVKGFTRDYAMLAAGDAVARPRYEAGAGAGYGTRRLGSLSVDFGAAAAYGGRDRRSAAVTYSRRIADRTTLFASYRNTRDVESTEELFVGVTRSLSRDVSLSGSVKRANDATTESAQVQKYVPAGEGYGLRAQAERTDGGDESATAFDTHVQYNARRAILTGEYRGRFPGGGENRNSYQFTASGGIAAVGGVVGLSRPVTDSFGVVAVDNLADVRVMVSNQEIGRTDAKGRVFVPNLGSYYENQVSIDDRDVPIDYAVDEVVKHVSPPLRSGSLIRFDARRFRALTGILSVRTGDAVRPVEYAEVRMTVAGRPVEFPTGKRGEFYLENIPPGSHRAAFDEEGKTCEFDVTVPASAELVVDLGSIVCETLR